MTDTGTQAQAPAYTIPAGYALKWERPSFHLLLSDGTVEGADKWLVACVKHGTTTPAATLTKADLLGRKGDRAQWCKGCAKDMADQPAPVAPGTLRVQVALTVDVDTAKWAQPADADATAALVAAIVASTGVTPELAAELAGQVTAKAVDVRTEVRDHVLAQVQADERLTAAGATVALRVTATPATAEAPAAK